MNECWLCVSTKTRTSPWSLDSMSPPISESNVACHWKIVVGVNNNQNKNAPYRISVLRHRPLSEIWSEWIPHREIELICCKSECYVYICQHLKDRNWICKLWDFMIARPYWSKNFMNTAKTMELTCIFLHTNKQYIKLPII